MLSTSNSNSYSKALFRLCILLRLCLSPHENLGKKKREKHRRKKVKRRKPRRKKKETKVEKKREKKERTWRGLKQNPKFKVSCLEKRREEKRREEKRREGKRREEKRREEKRRFCSQIVPQLRVPLA